jgi:replication factor C large subunit
LLWINENLPKEYIDTNDLVKGYDALSKADIFLGRTNRRQNYALWSYACDIMNGGIATAKTHNYPNDSYNFPLWLRARKGIKSGLDIRDQIVKKLSKISHNSNKKGRDFLLSYFTNMFRNNTYFAIKMKTKLDLSEAEIKYLLGSSHQHKLKKILLSIEKIFEKPIAIETNKKEEKEEKENLQPSLFDF